MTIKKEASIVGGENVDMDVDWEYDIAADSEREEFYFSFSKARPAAVGRPQGSPRDARGRRRGVLQHA